MDEEEKKTTVVEPDVPVENDEQPAGVSQPEPDEAPENQSSEPEQFEDDPDDNPVTWAASEYIHADKNGIWYLLFIIVVLGLIALDVFILRSYTFSALVIVMAIALVIYSRRPPREIHYALSEKHGLYVGEKLYAFSDFKAFGIIKDGIHHSIMLIPTKRFAPGVSVYFPDEVGEKIVDILGVRLPMKELKLDAMDTLVRALRL